MDKYPDSAEKMLDAVLASMGEAVLVIEPEGRRIQNCNAAAEHLFGYDKEELIGEPTEILHIDREHYEKFGKKGELVLDRGKVFRTEYLMRRKDGTVFDAMVTVSSIGDDLGWEAGVVSIIRDISDQKEAERHLRNERDRLRESQQIGQIGDWYYDIPTNQITWMPMMFEIYERDPQKGAPNYEELKNFYPDDFEVHEEMVERAVEEKKPYSYDIKINTEKGNTKYVHVEGKPRLNAEGEVVKLYGIVQDITERKKAYKSEKRLNQIFYRALNMAPMPVMMQNESGEITFVNETLCRKSGYDREELETFDDWLERAVLDDIKEDFLAAVEKIFKEGMHREEKEFPVRTKKGDIRKWTLIGVNLGQLPGDEEKTIMMTGIDVTELRETQDQMEMELIKFSQLFVHSPDAIAITDEQGTILDVNESFEEMFGYSFSNIKERNLDRLLTHSEEEFDRARQHTRRTREGKRYREEEVRYTKQGEPVNVIVGGAAVEMDGKVQSLFHLYTDITEQRLIEKEHARKEQELSTLFSNLPGMAYRCRNNRNWTMEFVSGGCEDLTGYQPDEVMDDHTVAYGNLIHEDDQDRVWQEVQHALESESHFELEYRVRTREDEIKWVWERGTALHYGDDDRLTLQGFISDITERKRQERQLEKLIDQKNTLIKEIHHRVKNNMAIVSGLLELQKQSITSEKVQDALVESQLRLQTMAQVHEQLYQREDFTDIRGDEYIKELIETISVAYSGQTLQITTNMGSFDLNVNQAIPLGLLMNELVINACKHAYDDQEEGEIEVSLELEGDQVTATVSDDGSGLPAEVDINNPESLGYTIIQTLIKQLDARMDLDNSGQGLDVHIYFTREELRGSSSNILNFDANT